MHSIPVVGTVRSAAKGDELKKLYSQYGGRFSYAIVPDIVKVRLSDRLTLYLTFIGPQDGAFDEVIKEGNFDGVAHAASPVIFAGATPDGKNQI